MDNIYDVFPDLKAEINKLCKKRYVCVMFDKEFKLIKYFLINSRLDCLHFIFVPQNNFFIAYRKSGIIIESYIKLE